jgi:hypothetical protein
MAMANTPKNTTPENYDESTGGIAEGGVTASAMTQDEILMAEKDILSGLLDLGKAKDDADNYRKIQIKRGGVLKLEFRLRPISEDENQRCWKQATKYAGTKPGQPKKPIETDNAKYRSYIIYTATVDEDRLKVWENRAAMDAFGLLQGVDMIDKVLLAGEKSRILDVIDEISGFDDDMEELAKNS